MGFTIYIDESCGLVLNQNCKAITASDVVISTRKCNGVTNLSWFSFRICFEMNKPHISIC